MSVINESLAGDDIYCLEEFVTSPHGQVFSWKTCKKIRVGERVRFLSWFRDENLAENPVCWMVVFEAADGKRYAGTQTYFATKECWEGLRKHFAAKPGGNRKAKQKQNLSGKVSAKQKNREKIS